MTNENKYELIESLGRINLDIYKDFFENEILTDELVLTRNRAEHVDERRIGILDKYRDEILSTINEPDLIIRDNKNPVDTVISIKKIDTNSSKNTYVVIKFTLEGNNPDYKNSIMTMMTI
ncbi:MAG: hypothetical protein RSB70_06695, partial [Clostridium sp.]